MPFVTSRSTSVCAVSVGGTIAGLLGIADATGCADVITGAGVWAVVAVPHDIGITTLN